MAVVLVASIGATVAIVASPTLGIQLIVVSAAVILVACLIVAIGGRTLNAAWVIVAAIYLLDPVQALLSTLGFPVPMVVLVALAPIAFVLTALFLHQDTRDRLSTLLPLVLLAAFAGLSLAWSPDSQYGARKLSLWLLTGLIPSAFIVVLASPSRPVQWKLIAAAAVVYAVTLLMFGSTASSYPGRLVFFDANPIWVARATYIGALIMLFGPFPALVRLLTVPILLVAGHLTDSLGPTIGLVGGAVAGVAEALRRADQSDRRVQLAWGAFALSVGTGSALFLAGAISAGPSDLTPVFGDPSVTSRASFLEAAGRAFVSAPIVGTGFGAFAATGLAEYPHNMVAEIAAELGVVGLVALLGWLGLAMRGALRSPLLVSLLTATTVFMLFSGSVASNVEFWLFSGLAVAMISRKERTSRPGETTGP